jgi:hypothetical protein
MALSGIEWQVLAVLTGELQNLQNCKPRENRTIEEQAVIDYFKERVANIEEKKNQKIYQ